MALPDPTLVAETFLEKPTAFGVPLGALLLFFWLMKAINENKTAGAGTGPVHPPSAQSTGFAPSTEAIPLQGEVSDAVVLFTSSGMKTTGGRTLFQFTVKLQQAGSFIVAAGQHRNGRLLRNFYGFTQISGQRGEVISGTINSPGFSSGIWAIGAYQRVEDIALA